MPAIDGGMDGPRRIWYEREPIVEVIDRGSSAMSYTKAIGAKITSSKINVCTSMLIDFFLLKIIYKISIENIV